MLNARWIAAPIGNEPSVMAGASQSEGHHGMNNKCPDERKGPNEDQLNGLLNGGVAIKAKEAHRDV